MSTHPAANPSVDVNSASQSQLQLFNSIKDAVIAKAVIHPFTSMDDLREVILDAQRQKATSKKIAEGKENGIEKVLISRI
jgi:hypothetical protein